MRLKKTRLSTTMKKSLILRIKTPKRTLKKARSMKSSLKLRMLIAPLKSLT